MPAIKLDPNVPAVDPSNGTTISLGTDGKLQISVGGAAATDVGGGTGVTNYLVTQPLDGTTMDLTGLDGDKATIFEVYGDIIYKGGSGNTTFTVEIPGVSAANLACYVQFNNGRGVFVGSSSGSPTSGWWSGAVNAGSDFHLIFKYTINVHTGRHRTFFGMGTTESGGTTIAWHSWGWCSADTTTPVTGITIRGSVANSIRANSWMLVRALNANL